MSKFALTLCLSIYFLFQALLLGVYLNVCTWLKVFAEAEHNPVPSEVQRSSGRSNETGAIAAPESVVNTTKAMNYINKCSDSHCMQFKCMMCGK